jgi:membrane-bound lytic murein transglycosylase B
MDGGGGPWQKRFMLTFSSRRPFRAIAAARALGLALAALLLLAALAPAQANDLDFSAWLRTLRAEAIAKGISRATVDRALFNIQPIPHVIELDHKQPEFTLTFQEYIDKVVSDSRVEKGRAMMAEHRDLLARVAKTYGVQPQFLLALWGIESDFGRITGDYPVVTALATLAYDGRRSSFFRGELMAALRILDHGYIDLPVMTGSWAGAMGQAQFMPSSYLRYAVDYDGTGHRDIWHSTPDVLASIANYLAQSGWAPGQGWGMEVRLPQSFDHNLVDLEEQKPLQDWATLGVTRLDGGPLPRNGFIASLVEPDGPGMGPAFVVYDNYRAIMKWNHSTFFATAAGLLADRIAGE